MTRAQQKSPTGRIFDNILFLAEVFGDQSDQDIPKMPVLETLKRLATALFGFNE